MKKWCVLAGVDNSGCVMTAGIFVVLFAIIADDNFADHSRHECTSDFNVRVNVDR